MSVESGFDSERLHDNQYERDCVESMASSFLVPEVHVIAFPHQQVLDRCPATSLRALSPNRKINMLVIMNQGMDSARDLQFIRDHLTDLLKSLSDKL